MIPTRFSFLKFSFLVVVFFFFKRGRKAKHNTANANAKRKRRDFEIWKKKKEKNEDNEEEKKMNDRQTNIQTNKFSKQISTIHITPHNNIENEKKKIFLSEGPAGEQASLRKKVKKRIEMRPDVCMYSVYKETPLRVRALRNPSDPPSGDEPRIPNLSSFFTFHFSLFNTHITFICLSMPL